MNSITTTSMPSAADFQAAVTAGQNIVISTKPGLGTVTDTMAALDALHETVVIVDVVFQTSLTAARLDHSAEIIVVDEVHLAGARVREQITELVQHHSINGEVLPQLKSVVVLFTHRNDETDQYAAQLAALAPALSINLSINLS